MRATVSAHDGDLALVKPDSRENEQSVPKKGFFRRFKGGAGGSNSAARSKGLEPESRGEPVRCEGPYECFGSVLVSDSR